MDGMLDQLSPDRVNEIIAELTPVVMSGALSFVAAIVILLVGLWLAGRLQRAVQRALARSGRVDAMLQGFFGSIVRWGVITVTILAVLAQFGIQTTSLIAVLGAAGLAIGLALQGTLSHLAAGVMLLIFRPFKVGDYVDAGGIAGTVKSLSLFHTELATPDNVQIIVPNGNVWGTAIHNYSFHELRRADLTFSIAYHDQIDHAVDAIKEIVGADERCLSEPEAFYGVNNLGESSVDIVCRIWTKNADYWPVKFDLTKKVKEKFDQEGITIPFPMRTVVEVGKDDLPSPAHQAPKPTLEHATDESE